jgi:hypothetical protein
VRINASFGGLRDLLDEVEGDIADAATLAMRATQPEARQELRDQVISAGLGARLANTWRGEVYPKSAKSVNPAGYIWSRAPDIIDAFAKGATIVPHAGRRYLAIPTDAVPRAGGRRGSTRRMTPEQVENRFNQDLIFEQGKSGRLLAYVDVLKAKGGSGYRAKTKGRVAQGRQSRLVLMFTMVPSAKMPKTLDLDAVAERWSRRFERDFINRVGR